MGPLSSTWSRTNVWSNTRSCLEYPGFDMATSQPNCESRLFRDKTDLVLLQLLAPTRSTCQNPASLLEAVQTVFQSLVQEMTGKVAGTRIMLY